MSNALPDGMFWRGDGTLGVTDDALRRDVEASDTLPTDTARPGDVGHRIDGTLWIFVDSVRGWWDGRGTYRMN